MIPLTVSPDSDDGYRYYYYNTSWAAEYAEGPLSARARAARRLYLIERRPSDSWAMGLTLSDVVDTVTRVSPVMLPPNKTDQKSFHAPGTRISAFSPQMNR